MASWSGFWNYVYDDGRTPISKPNSRIRRALRIAMRQSVRAPYNRIVRALAGAAPGATASGTYSRVAVQDVNDIPLLGLGGLRAKETVTSINRATTAADVTNIQSDLDYSKRPTWPGDKAGIGGGGLASTKGI